MKTMKSRTARMQTVRGRRRGIATLEFALILPVLLGLVLGIVEFGWMIKIQLTMANAAREGVRYAALGNTSTAVKTRVKSMSNTLSPGLTDDQILLDQTSDRASTNPAYTAWPADTAASPSKNGVAVGNLLRVNISYPHKPLTGFFPFLKNRTLTASASMAREVN